MMGMTNAPIENLRIWKEGMALAKLIYQHTAVFPKTEIYGLTSQMRRAAVSIPSNIAEGSQRETDTDFAHFIVITKGSWGELKTQILLAESLGYLAPETVFILMGKMHILGKQIGAFHRSLLSRASS